MKLFSRTPFHALCAIAATGVLSLLAATQVKAQPGFAYTAAGASSNSFPLSSTTSNRVQWLYTPAQFTPSLPATGLINTIYLRPGNSGSGTFTNLTVRLGNTTATAMTATAWAAVTTAYTNTTPLSWSANTWVPITLQTPFLYTGGNLIVDISQTGYTVGMTLSQNTTMAGGRAWGGAAAAAPTSSGTGQHVVGFDISPANCSGVPAAPVITTVAMNAAAPICGTSMTLTATNPAAFLNGINLQWQSGPSATGPFSNVTSGTGATTTTYTTPAINTTTWFRLAATCTNSNQTTFSTPYQVIAGAAQPGTITGRTTFCPGDTANYSVAAVAGNTYAWTLPTGWTGIPNANAIRVNMGSSAGSVSVTATNSCGPSIPRTLAVTLGTAPPSPNQVIGSGIVCPSSAQTFSTPNVNNATYYSWTLPSGWTGTSTSNTINVHTGSNSGIVSVRAGNGCGLSTPNNRTITVSTTLAAPGTITTSATNGQYCSGQLYNFSINPVPGATSYQWVLPTGWSGTISGTSIQAFAATGAGQLQVNAFSSCAMSPASVLNVTGAQSLVPTVSISAPSAVCTGIPNTFTALAANGGSNPSFIWRRNGVMVPVSGNSYLAPALSNGDVISVSMVSNLACRSADSAHSSYTTNLTPSVTPGVSISANKVGPVCAGTNVTFSTVAVGQGQNPGYQWYRNGLVISGATQPTYSTAGLANNDTITVELATSAVCATQPVVSSNTVVMPVENAVTPTVTVSASSTAANGMPVTFTANYTDGGPNPGFQWMRNNTAIPGAQSDVYTTSSLKPGDHISVRLISHHPCTVVPVVYSDHIVMHSAVGIGSQTAWQGRLSLYPNPSNGRFTINAEFASLLPGRNITVDVLNMVGQQVYHQEVPQDKTDWQYEVQLNPGLTNGSYILRLRSSDGMQTSLPFLLQR